MDTVDLPALFKNEFQIDIDSGMVTGLHNTNVITGRKNVKLFERILYQKRKKQDVNLRSMRPSPYLQFVAMIANSIHFVGQIDNIRMLLLQKHDHWMLWRFQTKRTLINIQIRLHRTLLHVE